ncbi:hypothetical protein LJC56_11785 [Christensenellaceae bacterium OttesenSCG-928-K19]|nr:hypothetical protein [Christensenellaceae bacterium OttesenSCG-928-K19]
MELRNNRLRDEQGMLLQDREVMKLLLRAKSRSEICKELGMPMGSVNTSCTRIYENTGVHSLAELLIRYANKNELEDIK